MSEDRVSWRRHLVWLAAAVATGLVAYGFNLGERVGEEIQRRALAVSPALPAALVAAGLLLICRLRDWLFPGTEGTGIPQAIAALKMGDHPARSRVLSARIALGKIVLLLLGLWTGPTIGREGPSVHVGACLMFLASRVARFPQHLVERGLILAGGAAGIAAAFNTPIAGIVFAFEEIGRSFEKDNAGMIVRTAIVACLTCIALLGNYLFYGRIAVSFDSVEPWLVVPVIGLVGGLLGGCFAQALVWTMPRVREIYARRPLVVAGVLGLILAGLGLASGGLTYGSGYQHARAILIDRADLPVLFAPMLAAASFTSLVSGIPGGLFDPTLTTGAGLGQLASGLVPSIDAQAIILLCMASYFAGVVQSPITACVILIEMTDARFLTLPLALAAILAYEASRLVCRTSLYEALADGFLRALRGSA